MRRLPLSLLLATCILLAGCTVAMGPPPPVPPPPPVDPDPTVRPDFSRSGLDALTVGMTAEQVAEAIGSVPLVIPQGGGPPTVRWEVTVDGQFHILYVVFDESGLLRDKGLVEVITIPNAP